MRFGILILIAANVLTAYALPVRQEQKKTYMIQPISISQIAEETAFSGEVALFWSIELFDPRTEQAIEQKRYADGGFSLGDGDTVDVVEAPLVVTKANPNHQIRIGIHLLRSNTPAFITEFIENIQNEPEDELVIPVGPGRRQPFTERLIGELQYMAGEAMPDGEVCADPQDFQVFIDCDAAGTWESTVVFEGEDSGNAYEIVWRYTVETLDAPDEPAAPSELGSEFAHDAEGWTVVQGGLLEWVAISEQDGILCASDDGTGSDFFFRSPPDWAGDLSGLYGGTIRYHITTDDPSDVTYGNPYDLMIVGSDATVFYTVGKPAWGSFSEFEVAIAEENLKIAFGPGVPGNLDDLMTALRSFEYFQIRGEYGQSVEGCLDAVIIDLEHLE